MKPVNISLAVSRLCFFCGSFLLVMLRVGVCCVVVSVPCSRVVICWETPDLAELAWVELVLGRVDLHPIFLSYPHTPDTF